MINFFFGKKYTYLSILASITFLFVVNLINISNPILDNHSFRQTQTAISAYYISLDGEVLRYITPVLGYPWSIPFEFPLYQLIVATTSKFFNSSLDATGRLTAFVFFIMTLFVFGKILKLINLGKTDRWIILLYIALMPLYLFWAGTFLIESTALFFTISFLYFYIKIKTSPSGYINYIFFSVCLSAGLMQKVTTILIPFLCVCGFELFLFFKTNVLNYLKNKKNYVLPLAVFIAMAPFFYWLNFSNEIKLSHPLAWSLTSDHLNSWNFGTFEELYRKEFWFAFVVRATLVNSSAGLGLIFILYYLRTPDLIHYKKIVVVFLFIYVLPFFTFKPLHRIHEYYQFANIIYLGGAIGLSVARLSAINTIRIFKVIPALLILVNVFIFFNFYAEKKFTVINEHNNRTLALAKEIKSQTDPSLPIVIYGYDWSAELPYYSERKALMVPDWRARGSEFKNQSIEITKNYDRYLPTKPSVVVFCDQSKYLAEKIVFTSKYSYIRKNTNSGCVLYYM